MHVGLHACFYTTFIHKHTYTRTRTHTHTHTTHTHAHTHTQRALTHSHSNYSLAVTSFARALSSISIGIDACKTHRLQSLLDSLAMTLTWANVSVATRTRSLRITVGAVNVAAPFESLVEHMREQDPASSGERGKGGRRGRREKWERGRENRKRERRGERQGREEERRKKEAEGDFACRWCL